MNWYRLLVVSQSLLLLMACNEPVYTPKPRSFPRVDFPAKAYQSLAVDFCSFTFDYPTYTVIQQDTAFFEERPPHGCWFDVYYPLYDGRIHFTYAPLGGNAAGLEALTQDAFGMADWHNKRADYIDELLIDTPNGVTGFAFDIDGEAASPFQFFLTDSTHHFVRAALYFNAKTNADSLRPVVDYVRDDILHIIETFKWVE